MATTEMNCLASGGGGSISGEYKLLQTSQYDSTSRTITIPSNTDFVIVAPLQMGSTNYDYDTSSSGVNVGIIEVNSSNVGKTISWSKAVVTSSIVNNAQTVTLTNLTTLTQTRGSSSGYMLYLFCQRT